MMDLTDDNVFFQGMFQFVYCFYFKFEWFILSIIIDK